MSRFVLALILFGLSTGVGFGQEVTVELTNSIGMTLVLIPKGTFMMGSPESEEGHREDEVQHEVTLTRDFYLGITEVTQAQYQKVMGENPSFFQGDKFQGESSNHPVEQVSWEDAVEFCKKLSDLPEEKASGRVYRLPTEAEWEFACRAGSKTAYSFGDNGRDLGNHAWFGNNSGSKELDTAALMARFKDNYQEYSDTIKSAGCATHPVGEKKANAWGLYDMHGNVWEWCSNWYGEYPKGAVSDPTGAREGLGRVIRGGCWINGAAYCRSAFRYWYYPSYRIRNFGFRVALSSPEIPKQAEPEQDK